MAEVTGISWCDATFNPWHGCQKVGPGCDHCYAERDAKRFAAGRVLWGIGGERRTFGDKHWKAPHDWAKQPFVECMGCAWRGPASKATLRSGLPGFHRDPGAMRCCPACNEPLLKETRRRVFCASMGDWLDLDAPLDQFVRLLETIRSTPELDWLLLSKRIGNWRKRLLQALDSLGAVSVSYSLLIDWIQDWIDGNAPHNVWLGATVVNQEEADRDVPKLLAVPARVRSLSIEPMLGSIRVSLDADRFRCPSCRHAWNCIDETDCPRDECPNCGFDPVIDHGKQVGVDWVICGGESGPQARPMHPDWVRSLRDQCEAAGVPFHFKQWGEWAGHDQPGVDMLGTRDSPLHRWPDDAYSVRVGKKAAGRQLDGRTHDECPPC